MPEIMAGEQSLAPTPEPEEKLEVAEGIARKCGSGLKNMWRNITIEPAVFLISFSSSLSSIIAQVRHYLFLYI